MVLSTLAALSEAGVVSCDHARALQPVAERFRVSVSEHLVGLIDPGAENDPIARQYLPRREELEHSPEERLDPIGDEAHAPLVGVVHRYPDRVLLKVTHLCSVYCRFCFRREAIGPDKVGLSKAQLDAAIAYIANRPQVWEAILSGGDPLILSARRLSEILNRLEAIDHLGLVRIHSRVPVTDPERITPALVKSLRRTKPVWLLLHVNHAREFAPSARAAIARLIEAGIPILGQSVLLRGVNDTLSALSDLFRAMVECRIKPHYLHQADLARGTAHFRVPIAQGQALVRALRKNLSGLCQPTYMLDIPDGYGKIPIGPSYLEAVADRVWQATDHREQRHRYCDSAAL